MQSDNVNSVDGSGLMSRQFLMYMGSMLTWKALLFYGIYADIGDGVLMAFTGGATAVESALGVMRAWHDKNVKVDAARVKPKKEVPIET